MCHSKIERYFGTQKVFFGRIVVHETGNFYNMCNPLSNIAALLLSFMKWRTCCVTTLLPGRPVRYAPTARLPFQVDLHHVVLQSE